MKLMSKSDSEPLAPVKRYMVATLTIAFIAVLAVARAEQDQLPLEPAYATNTFVLPAKFLETCLQNFGRAEELLSAFRLPSLTSLIGEYNGVLHHFCNSRATADSSEVVYYLCLNDTGVPNNDFTDSLCAADENNHSPVLIFVEGAKINASNSYPPFICDAKCRQHLMAVTTYLGCCARHLYSNHWVSSHFSHPFDRSCGVRVRSLCRHYWFRPGNVREDVLVLTQEETAMLIAEEQAPMPTIGGETSIPSAKEDSEDEWSLLVVVSAIIIGLAVTAAAVVIIWHVILCLALLVLISSFYVFLRDLRNFIESLQRPRLKGE